MTWPSVTYLITQYSPSLSVLSTIFLLSNPEVTRQELHWYRYPWRQPYLIYAHHTPNSPENTAIQCWFYAGPALQTLAQHTTSIEPTFLAGWYVQSHYVDSAVTSIPNLHANYTSQSVRCDRVLSEAAPVDVEHAQWCCERLMRHVRECQTGTQLQNHRICSLALETMPYTLYLYYLTMSSISISFLCPESMSLI